MSWGLVSSFVGSSIAGVVTVLLAGALWRARGSDGRLLHALAVREVLLAVTVCWYVPLRLPWLPVEVAEFLRVWGGLWWVAFALANVHLWRALK